MPNDPAVPDVDNPARYIPPAAIAFGAKGSDATFVDAAHPLPVEHKLTASGAAPLAGSVSATGVLGPFTPKPGRAIWLTLSGSWTGTVTTKRSVDGGTSKFPLTAGGQPWAAFTANANEQIAEESESGATWYLDVTLASGTLTYRLAQ